MRQQKRERDSKSKKEGRFLSDNTTHGKRERGREQNRLFLFHTKGTVTSCTSLFYFTSRYVVFIRRKIVHTN
jgi:hypothetical protein